MKLVKLIYYGRHGHRAPLKMPEEDKVEWGGAGVLTSKGAEAQYNKGKKIREKYEKMFEEFKDTPDNIYVQSSNLDRTIDSAFCLTSGLLNKYYVPPTTVSRKEKVELLKQYGAKLKPLNRDVLYRAYFVDVSPSVAPIFDELIDKAIARRDHFKELVPLVPKAHVTVGINPDVIMDYFGLFFLFDYLHCYQINDHPLPKAFPDNSVHDKIEFVHLFLIYDLMFVSDTIRRLTNHYIYKEIISIITSKAGPKIHYFSSHDSNVFALILGLGHNIKEVTPCADGIIIEIYEDANGRYVNFEYKNENINQYIWKGKDPSGFIPMDEVLKIMQKECFADDEEYKKFNGNKTFDYLRDYVNAKEETLEDSQAGEHKALSKMFTKQESSESK